MSWLLSDSSASDQQQGLGGVLPALNHQVSSPGKWEEWCLPPWVMVRINWKFLFCMGRAQQKVQHFLGVQRMLVVVMTVRISTLFVCSAPQCWGVGPGCPVACACVCVPVCVCMHVYERVFTGLGAVTLAAQGGGSINLPVRP